MVKISGKMLNFGEVDMHRCIFNENCCITIPETVPIIINLSTKSQKCSKFVGTANVYRNNDCLFVTGEINGPIENFINKTTFYFEGLYLTTKTHKRAYCYCISNSVLTFINLYYGFFTPVNPEFMVKVSGIHG